MSQTFLVARLDGDVAGNVAIVEDATFSNGDIALLHQQGLTFPGPTELLAILQQSGEQAEENRQRWLLREDYYRYCSFIISQGGVRYIVVRATH